MSFATTADLHDAIKQREPREFVSRFLFEPIPFAFSNDIDQWIAWKSNLAERLEVDPYDLVLTGSGAIGFSLNPAKNYRAFDDNSDIDVGVISAHHFEVAWRYLRQLRPSWLTLPKEARSAIESHRKNYVFSGTIATDSILALLPFGQVWQEALDGMASVTPTNGREVRLRIYKDFDALRAYQAYGIGRLRDDLLEKGDEETLITTDERE